AKEVPDHLVEFFSLKDHNAPILRLGKCTLADLKMTRIEGCSELWIKVEHENTDALHAFVKDYAFQRFWAEFAPVQIALPNIPPARMAVMPANGKGKPN